LPAKTTPNETAIMLSLQVIISTTLLLISASTTQSEHSHHIFGHQPKVWLTVSSLVEKVKVNGHKFITKRKIELNWTNLPIFSSRSDSPEKKDIDTPSNDKNAVWVALFAHDQQEPDSESALVSLQPKMMSRGRFR